jgi:hypothetical protein
MNGIEGSSTQGVDGSSKNNGNVTSVGIGGN